MSRSLLRREFLQQSAAAGVAAGFFVNPTAQAESNSPNERLNIAGVGATNRAAADLAGVATQNIIAIADIDSQLLEKGAAHYPKARKYADFREMLDKEADRIDAVVVGTPDHTHAPAAAMALRLKKHVYCEKPLTHTVKEARVLTELASKSKLVTQMGNQIHAGENYRRVVEIIQAGVIGNVKRCHVWSGARYSGAKFKSAEKPSHVNWDLWLGPAKKRPYSAGVHPFDWRSFWDYGTGALGDFGCHFMDLAHWALKLTHPTKISAQGPEFDPVSTPEWCVVDYNYPAREGMPPVHLTWYDSGRKPKILERLKGGSDFGSGQLFIGDRGLAVLSDYSRHRIYSLKSAAEFQAGSPEPSIPKSIGHHEEWLNAIKNGGRTTCEFAYTGPLTEAVLLGTVAYRSGRTVNWDAKNLKTDHPDSQQFVHKEYRKGWEL